MLFGNKAHFAIEIEQVKGGSFKKAAELNDSLKAFEGFNAKVEAYKSYCESIGITYNSV